MKGLVVYLCGPIDCVDPESAGNWRRDVSQYLKEEGILTFDPFLAWGGLPVTRTVEAHPLKAIARVDLYAVLSSDVVLARISKDVPTCGSYIEIGYALALGIPVVIWSDNPPPFLKGAVPEERIVGTPERILAGLLAIQKEITE